MPPRAALAALLLLAAAPAMAFPPEDWSAQDVRALQAGLAWAGSAAAPLDGVWSDDWQAALEGWRRANPPPLEMVEDATIVVHDWVTAYRTQTWRWLSGAPGLFLPVAGLVPETREDSRAWSDPATGLFAQAGTQAEAEVTALHAEIDALAPEADHLQLRDPDRWVTAFTDATGTRIHLASRRGEEAWDTTLVTAPEDLPALSLILAATAEAGAPLLLPAPGGPLDTGQRELAQFLALAETEAAEARSEEDADSSGTAFRITAEGTFLTNEHVIAGCTEVTVNGLPAVVLEADPEADLALLAATSPGEVLPFAPEGPRLNADVTVGGYPLHDMLGSFNVTRGAITSIDEDDLDLQISAAVHPGNSGGPAVDKAGRVIGVVVATADAETFLDEGILPQNLNYAVRGDVAQAFLAEAGVTVQTAPPGAALAPEDIADRLVAATALVLCY